MTRFIASVLLFGAAACASVPVPHERVAAAESSYRGAMEAGAEADPQARLALKLSEEELGQARQLIEQKRNGEAVLLLERSKADAELAVGLAREAKAEAEAQQAISRTRGMQGERQ